MPLIRKHSTMIPFTMKTFLHCLCVLVVIAAASSVAEAQFRPGYEPLSEKLPPGYTADVLARIRHQDLSFLQPIRVELPTDGTVTVYSGSPEPRGVGATPAQFSANIGHLYRLRVSDMPEFPGEELYPSIEVLDRLHAPNGAAASYPIPVVLSAEDLNEAIEGRLVTRVIYLENPRLASPEDTLRSEPANLNPADNALQEAGLRGRPMIIVRIGGRIPTETHMPLSFYGTGGAVDMSDVVAPNTGVARSSDKQQPFRSSVASRQPQAR
jgi:hypothetical protein